MRALASIAAAMCAFLICSTSVAADAADENLEILRIGTGGTGGTYFPIGSLIAQAVSEQRDDDGRVRDQGVKGLLAVAQISNGSIANVNGMRRGRLTLRKTG